MLFMLLFLLLSLTVLSSRIAWYVELFIPHMERQKLCRDKENLCVHRLYLVVKLIAIFLLVGLTIVVKLWRHNNFSCADFFPFLSSVFFLWSAHNEIKRKRKNTNKKHRNCCTCYKIILFVTVFVLFSGLR